MIASLRIILNDVQPQPMRHIEVPIKLRLDRLHAVIQAVMGWTDTHLYKFRIRMECWGLPDLGWSSDGPKDAAKVTLDRLLGDAGVRTIQYLCDFGDYWDQNIRIEQIDEASPGIAHPRLITATGACPPEDVGGAGGYEEVLEALADPDHDQQEDMFRRWGGDFNSEDARIDRIVERFDRFAKKWAPQPRKPKDMT